MNGRPSDEADPPATEAAGRAAEAEKTPEGSPSEGTPGKRETLCANLFGHASGACSWQRDRPSAGPPARRSARSGMPWRRAPRKRGKTPRAANGGMPRHSRAVRCCGSRSRSMTSAACRAAAAIWCTTSSSRTRVRCRSLSRGSSPRARASRRAIRSAPSRPAARG